MSKIGVVIISALLLGQSLTASQHSFYVGANVGIKNITAKTTNEISGTNHLYLDNNKKINSKSLIGGIYAMYLLKYNTFGLASEISFQYNNFEKNLNRHFFSTGNYNLFFKIRHRMRGSVELNIKPGFFVNNYFTYAILGLSYQNMFYDYTVTGSDTLVDPGAVQWKDKKRKIVNGTILGAGVHKDLSESTAVGLEFKLTKFPSRKYNFMVTNNNIDINLSSTLKNINTYSYCLRFMYKF